MWVETDFQVFVKPPKHVEEKKIQCRTPIYIFLFYIITSW